MAGPTVATPCPTILEGCGLLGHSPGRLPGASLLESALLGRLMGVGHLVPASWSRPYRGVLQESLGLGRLQVVGLGDSRPEEGGPASWVLQGSISLLFFVMAKGSRLGYPWSPMKCE